jgi:hypothetical protein
LLTAFVVALDWCKWQWKTNDQKGHLFLSRKSKLGRSSEGKCNEAGTQPVLLYLGFYNDKHFYSYNNKYFWNLIWG